jgi:hypothetical protein
MDHMHINYCDRFVFTRPSFDDGDDDRFTSIHYFVSYQYIVTSYPLRAGAGALPLQFGSYSKSWAKIVILGQAAGLPPFTGPKGRC